MSTPSTATATLPPHQHQYCYPNNQAWQTYVSQQVNGPSRLANAHFNNAYSGEDLCRTATANTRPPPPEPYHPPHTTVAQQPLPGMPVPRQKRRPNWSEFYKNGLPKEVIVIHDTPEPQPSRPVAVAGDNHADKRLKTNKSTAYDAIYPQATSCSTTQTPVYTPSDVTVSTDRTVSAVHTTAATSLGSTVSRAAYPPCLDPASLKRKRTTRQTVRDEAKEAKRRETEQHLQHRTVYQPPQLPPIKAKDVHVKVVPDKLRPHDKVDDEDGHYIVDPDTDFANNYEIIKLLGQGTFGKVVEAVEKKNGKKVAIKVIRSVQKYRDASRIELRVLSTLASNDPHNRNKCIHLRDCFDFRGHICIVTDLYSQSVFDFLKANRFVPFPSTHIQTFAHQLLTSVAFLHDLNLIHTDLKPENILLVDSACRRFTYNRTIPSSSAATARSARHRNILINTEIRLIDFGSATFDDEYHSSVVSTRHYRAPEIILNLGWSYPCDIWSIGCILVEFFTGDALFQTHDNLEHLAMMEVVCGVKLDKHLIRQVHAKERGQTRNPAAQYFKGQRLDYPNADTPKSSRKYVKAMKRLDETINPSNDFLKQLVDLLKRIFVYDPSKRITAKQALNHPWFREHINDDGTQVHKCS